MKNWFLCEMRFENNSQSFVWPRDEETSHKRQTDGNWETTGQSSHVFTDYFSSVPQKQIQTTHVKASKDAHEQDDMLKKTGLQRCVIQWLSG